MSAAQHGKKDLENAGKSRIMAAARTLFSSHGFHQTSMAELATAAQVSVGQIYRIFRGKEDIIEALVLDDAEERSVHMAALRSRLTAGELTIEQTFEELYRRTIDEEDEALSFDILAESFRNPAVADTVGNMCIGLRAFLRDFAYAANPKLSGEALYGAEELILACMFGLGHRSLSLPRLSTSQSAYWSARMIVAALRAIR